jgi:glycosyltransferase involved in cell wall biosynthesis
MNAPTNDVDTGPGTIVFPFLGAELGGSHMSAFTLGQELMQHFGKRCIVIAAKNSLIEREALNRGFEVAASGERPAMRNTPLYDLLRLLPRMGRLRAHKADAVLHCNDIGTLQSWGLAARMMGMPVVYHHRALNRMVLPNRMVLAIADAIICISDRVRESLSGLSQERIATILNPFSIALSLDRKAARAALIERYGFERDAYIAGFIGNFWVRKRPHFFLDACRYILGHNPKARFVLFGRNGEITEAQLRAYAREIGIADRTVFAGFQLPAEKNVAALDLLLAPALAEPFGRTLIEALLLGTPYVATDDAGHGEIASQWKGGVLVDAKASAEHFARIALAVAIAPETIVLPPERRCVAAADLSAEGHARKVIGIYRKVACRP